MHGMKYDPNSHRYNGARNVVYARGGMVCASQPLAARVGLKAIERGGNAVDAALACAITLTVTEPTSNGIGGDAFALVWDGSKLHGLNASGPAPALLGKGSLKNPDSINPHGWEAVTVPGAVAGWAALSERFGKLTFGSLFEDAVRLAREGYPVSSTCAHYWEKAHERYKEILKGDEFTHWFDTFAPGGSAPQAGSLWRSEGHARTLEAIAESRSEAFYRGQLAEKIDAFSRATGGFLRGQDLAAFKPEWVTPISARYRDHDVWEIPPNGQGMVALSALGMLNGDDLSGLAFADAEHLRIEALKLAFADAHAYISESSSMPYKPEELLAPAYLAGRRALIGPQAMLRDAGQPERGGTVYLAAADGSGMMVSYIQSNYMGFGSGLVVPGTGIALHNRGHNFSAQEGHPNMLEPGKRPYHTIVPGFLTKDGSAVGPFGVMGGFMQPQGHLQVLSRCLDEGANPQEALDAPRFQWMRENTVHVEEDYDLETAESLRRRGHRVIVSRETGSFGRGQIIWRDPNGTLCGATEKRCDGTVAAF